VILINPRADALGSHCAIVGGRARRYSMRGVRAPLSLKSVVSGTAEWTTSAGRFELVPGMLLIVNDGEEYAIEVDALQPVETFCVFFSDGFVDDARHSAVTSSAALLDSDARPRIAFRERLSFDGALMRSMNGAREARDEASMYALAMHLVRASDDIRARVAALPALKPATRVELGRRVGLALELMHGALDRPLTVEEIAREACLSPFHFHRLFVAFTGQTPHRYLRRLRLQRARAMLRRGDTSVVGVAQACGFESPTSFSAAFRREFGASPRGVAKSQE
jgi:AraC family transcriptional regulator